MRILQLAGDIPADWTGTRSTLRALAQGYLAAGHSVLQVVPGTADRRWRHDGVETVSLRAPRLPAVGRRMIVSGRRMSRLLDDVRPDRIEVFDHFTLQAVGRWARRHGVPSVAVSQERLDALLSLHLRHPGLARFLADFWNLRLAASFDTIVCATEWAGREFERLGAPNLARVPLGVDLQAFHPRHASTALRRLLRADDDVLLVMAHHLVPQMRPELAIETVRALRRRDVPARLLITGTGPLLAECQRVAAGLPVTFLGHDDDRGALARVLATADVALAPAPAPLQSVATEALEVLASGTPVVGRRDGALAELVSAGGGVMAAGHAMAFAAAVTDIMAKEPAQRRALARASAERFAWPATVDQMLAVHGATPSRRAA
jgi:alpha-1,6-mannosyltransferase